MHHTDGGDGGTGRCERLVDGKLVHRELRRTGVVVFPKAVAHVPENGGGHVGFGPHVDGAEVRKRAQVVESGHVVEMLVGEEHGFERRHGIGSAGRFVESGRAGLFVAHFSDVPFVVGEGRVGAVRVFGDEAQHLHAEVGPAVDEQEAVVVGFEQGRAAQTVVAHISRGADGTGTAHLGHTGRGAGAEKVKSHEQNESVGAQRYNYFAAQGCVIVRENV